MNELLIILTLLISIFGIYVAYYFLKQDGLYIFVCLMTVLTMMLALKIGKIYGFEINLGIISFISIIVCLGLLVQKHGVKEAKKGVLISLVTACFSFVFLFISARYVPTVNDIISINLESIFSSNVRVLLGYIVAIVFSGWVYIQIYAMINKIFNDIFISNSLAGIFTSLMFAIILVAIGYLGKFPDIKIMSLILSRFLLTLLILILHTPIMYYINKMKKVKS